MPTSSTAATNLEPYWMPFTANRKFKQDPRLFVAAEGMHYTTADGRKLLDGTAGLWCCNIGHTRPGVVDAVQKQIATLDYASSFQMGHPKAFELADRVAGLMPGTLDHVFFTNSGSESVDTALKIALAYHAHKGEGTRTRFIGRERAYHGVGFGGISVCGLVNNRKLFGPLLPGADHLPHTHGLKENLFSRGLPAHGAHLADDLERIVGLHGAESIAAVIVEPVAGATGVLLPPQGYLKRLRDICTKYGILLIFDEVVTAFGRLGNAATTAELFGIQPDIITMAKGLTSGTIPMGAVAVDKKIYDAFMQGPESAIEFFHGYTYSGHPVAAAAGLATLDIYRDEKLFARTEKLAPHWENALHSLKDHPHVVDIRNFGLIGAIELEPIEGKPGARGFDIFLKCFEKGVFIRAAGDTIVLSPPLIISEAQINEIADAIGHALDGKSGGINATSNSSPAQGAKGKVLIIEDNPVNAKLLRAYLGEGGYEVVHAPSGHEGVEIMTHDPQGIEAILLDRMMPDMDGLEALRRLKLTPRAEGVPVIMLSGALSKLQIEEATMVGAYGCLHKPYDKEEIIAMLDQAFEDMA